MKNSNGVNSVIFHRKKHMTILTIIKGYDDKGNFGKGHHLTCH